MDIYVTSAFSKNNSGGNKAGVVFDSFNLTTKQKMETAKELGFSETAFLSGSQVADVRLQYAEILRHYMGLMRNQQAVP